MFVTVKMDPLSTVAASALHRPSFCSAAAGKIMACALTGSERKIASRTMRSSLCPVNAIGQLFPFSSFLSAFRQESWQYICQKRTEPSRLPPRLKNGNNSSRDPFLRNLFQAFPAENGRTSSVFCQLKSICRGKTHSPQDPKGILLKS